RIRWDGSVPPRCGNWSGRVHGAPCTCRNLWQPEGRHRLGCRGTESRILSVLRQFGRHHRKRGEPRKNIRNRGRRTLRKLESAQARARGGDSDGNLYCRHSLSRHLRCLRNSDHRLHAVAGALSLDLRGWRWRAGAVPDFPDVRAVVSRTAAKGTVREILGLLSLGGRRRRIHARLKDEEKCWKTQAISFMASPSSCSRSTCC